VKPPFHSCHPYLSFTAPVGFFVTPDGRALFASGRFVPLSRDLRDLWFFGKAVLAALLRIKPINSRDAFDAYHQECRDLVEAMRYAIKNAVAEGSILIHDVDCDDIGAEVDDLPPLAIIAIAADEAERLPQFLHVPDIKEFLLLDCLQCIDDAATSLSLNEHGVSDVLAAAERFANFQVLSSEGAHMKRIRSEMASRSALARHRDSPKQKAKLFIKECWDAWQQHPERYRTQTEFVKDVLTKIDVDQHGNPIIESTTVYNKWIREWKRG
jgi:hypothetical protein